MSAGCEIFPSNWWGRTLEKKVWAKQENTGQHSCHSSSLLVCVNNRIHFWFDWFFFWENEIRATTRLCPTFLRPWLYTHSIYQSNNWNLTRLDFLPHTSQTHKFQVLLDDPAKSFSTYPSNLGGEYRRVRAVAVCLIRRIAFSSLLGKKKKTKRRNGKTVVSTTITTSTL